MHDAPKPCTAVLLETADLVKYSLILRRERMSSDGTTQISRTGSIPRNRLDSNDPLDSTTANDC